MEGGEDDENVNGPQKYDGLGPVTPMQGPFLG